MATVLSRDCAPATTRTALLGRSSALASSRSRAAFARPSTGGAVTRTRSTPSCQPAIVSRAARWQHDGFRVGASSALAGACDLLQPLPLAAAGVFASWEVLVPPLRSG